MENGILLEDLIKGGDKRDDYIREEEIGLFLCVRKI